MTWALLPVVGQLYTLPPLWAVCRYLLRRGFHLPIAMGMVILINPPLKVFLFYGYALTGDVMLRWVGQPGIAGGYDAFRAALTQDGGSWLSNSAAALEVAVTRFGPSLVVGGIFWSIVGGPLCFALAWWAIARNRRRTAAGEAQPVPAETQAN